MPQLFEPGTRLSWFRAQLGWSLSGTESPLDKDHNLGFALRSFGLFFLLAILNFWPVLLGRIPLPTDLIVQFPPWETLEPALRKPIRHAEIGDLVTAFYPWRSFLGTTIKGGALPLWNPFELLGTPFVGNAQSAIFYPLNVLYALFPVMDAWAGGFVIRTTLAGFFMSLFARSQGATRAGSIGAGVVWAYCAFTTVWQSQSLGDAALWLPLILWSIRLVWSRPSPGAVGLLALSLSLSVLAGHPETSMHVALTSAAYAVFLLCTPTSISWTNRDRAMFALRLSGAGALAVALSAAQLLPTVEWLTQIGRPIDHRWGARPLSDLVAFVSRDIASNPNSVGVAIPEGAGYVGFLSLLLAPFSIAGASRRSAAFFLAVLLVSVGVAYGITPFYEISRNLPLVAGAKNYRLIGVASFCIAALAGLGLSSLERRCKPSGELTLGSRLWNAITWFSIFSILAVATVVVTTSFQGSQTIVASNDLALGATFLLSAAIIVGWRLLARPSRRAFAFVAVLALSADLIPFSHAYVPFASRLAVFPESPVFTFLSEVGGSEYRMLPVDGTFAENFEMMYGLSSATGYDNPVRRTERLLKPLGFVAAASQASAQKVTELEDRRLDLMNVKYIVATTHNSSASRLASKPARFRLAFASGSVRVFENLTVLPFAQVIPIRAAEFIPAEEDQLTRLGQRDFDPAVSVILAESPDPVEVEQIGGSAVGQTTITSIERGADSVSVLLSAGEPSIVVISQAYYPGWKVTVNERQSRVLRADYGLAGVQVGAGQHLVRFSYEPDSLWWGIRISAVALVLTVVMLSAGLRNSIRHGARRAATQRDADQPCSI